MTKRSLLLIVLGIAIGASMGFAGFYQCPPNSITFKVLRTGKVYLDPKAGDVITWKNESGAPVKIFFAFPPTSPCNEGNGTAICTVKTPIPTGIFDYTCKDTGIICTDPGIDPDPGGGGLGPSIALGPSVSGLTTSDQVVGLQVGCDTSGNVSVVDSNSASTPPKINDGAIIQWTSPDKTFSISGTSLASACASSSLVSGDAVQWCTSTSSPTAHPLKVNYTATVSACTGKKSDTFSFSLK